ncbi:hypothetical protein GW17_00020813, partial [Ensete ventricosum]
DVVGGTMIGRVLGVWEKKNDKDDLRSGDDDEILRQSKQLWELLRWQLKDYGLANKAQSKDSTQSTMVRIQLPSSFRKNPNPSTPFQRATIIAPIQVAPLCTIDGLPYPWGAARAGGHRLYGGTFTRSLPVVCRRWLDPVGGLIVGVHPRLVTLTTSDRPNMVLGHKRLPL